MRAASLHGVGGGLLGDVFHLLGDFLLLVFLIVEFLLGIAVGQFFRGSCLRVSVLASRSSSCRRVNSSSCALILSSKLLLDQRACAARLRM